MQGRSRQQRRSQAPVAERHVGGAGEGAGRVRRRAAAPVLWQYSHLRLPVPLQQVHCSGCGFCAAQQERTTQAP